MRTEPRRPAAMRKKTVPKLSWVPRKVIATRVAETRARRKLKRWLTRFTRDSRICSRRLNSASRKERVSLDRGAAVAGSSGEGGGGTGWPGCGLPGLVIVGVAFVARLTHRPAWRL